MNRFLIDTLVDLVVSGRSGRLAWDLYAGVGLFARALCDSFERVIAVESSPASSSDLRHNLEATSHRVVQASTLDFLQKQKRIRHAARPRGCRSSSRRSWTRRYILAFPIWARRDRVRLLRSRHAIPRSCGAGKLRLRPPDNHDGGHVSADLPPGKRLCAGAQIAGLPAGMPNHVCRRHRAVSCFKIPEERVALRAAANRVEPLAFSAAPALFAASCFATGVLLSRALYVPAPLALFAALLSASVVAFASRLTLRMVLLPLSLAWNLSGLFCAEIHPWPSPADLLARLRVKHNSLNRGRSRSRWAGSNDRIDRALRSAWRDREIAAARHPRPIYRRFSREEYSNDRRPSAESLCAARRAIQPVSLRRPASLPRRDSRT